MKISLSLSLWVALVLIAASAQPLAADPGIRPQAIGFTSVSLPQGIHLLSNPFPANSNTISNLLPNPPSGSVLLKWGTNGPSQTLSDPQATLISQWIAKFPGGTSSNSSGGIQFVLSSNSLKLTWTGTLQTSTNVVGPYTIVTNTNQPLVVKITERRRFWRVPSSSTNQPGSGTNQSSISALSLKQFTVALFTNGHWSAPNLTLNPGEAAAFLNPTTNSYAANFSGQISEGTFTNSIPAGLSLISSLAPISGGLTTNLGLQPNASDKVVLWNGKDFQVFTFQSNKTWLPAEPQIDLGSAFFIQASQPILWQQTVNLNPGQ